MKRISAFLASLIAVTAVAADGDWPNYGRTPGGDRHSPLARSIATTSRKLALAWEYKTGEAGIETGDAHGARSHAAGRSTACMYLATPLGKVIALDPVTGKQLWARDPAVKRNRGFGDWVNRGVSYWSDSRVANPRRLRPARHPGRHRCAPGRAGCAQRRTLCTAFGKGDGRPGRRACATSNPTATSTSRPRRRPSSTTSSWWAPPSPTTTRPWAPAAKCAPSTCAAARCAGPGIPCRRIPPIPRTRTWRGRPAFAAAAPTPGPSSPRIRSAIWCSCPPPARPSTTTASRGWATTATPIPSWRCARRPASWSWHFQTVHHDLWDYDNAAPPALITLPDGKDAVLQGTKTAQLFVLDRDTGAPLFPVEERAVPKSDVAGEETSPTQPLSALSVGLSHAHRRTTSGAPRPRICAECRARFATLRYDGPFTPPSERGSRHVARPTSAVRTGVASPTTPAAASPSCLTTGLPRWSR